MLSTQKCGEDRRRVDFTGCLASSTQHF
jgi:hypothetical protein